MNLILPTDLSSLEEQMLALARFQYLARADDAWLSRIDSLLPPDQVSTDSWTREKRMIKGKNELAVHIDIDLTPYVSGIHDAADTRGVEVIAVQGPARSVKTVAAENIALKRWDNGPHGDMLWYMQSADDVDDYMEERGEWMLENHEGVAERVDRTYKRQSRRRKRIGESMARWLPASKQTTRGKGAPFIVGDEIDAWQRRILSALPGLLRNRQREFGSAALLYLASHPDAGPTLGISNIISQGVQHLWWWCCIHCGKPSSPAAEASIRMNWNVPALMPMIAGVDKSDALDFVQKEAKLICPHCQGAISGYERLAMSRETGAWVQPGEMMTGPKTVEGIHRVEEIMGFIIHAFQAPFVDLGKAAREWVAAQIDFDNTGDDNALKEVSVKTLGEVFAGASEDSRIEDWETISKRMKSGDSYLMGQVPDGVDFLVAFVDIQRRGFEVRVIGFDAHGRQSWFIDGFLVGQHQEEGRKMDPVDPMSVLADWYVLEDAVLSQSYPLASNPEWHMPIAKVAIDLQGTDETTQNARIWASSVIHRDIDPIPDWRILLVRGSSHKTGQQLYGVAKQVLKDDHGKDIGGMLGPVWERTVLTYQLKKIIRKRQNIAIPGPGFMNAPQNFPEKYAKELVAERHIGGEWVRTGDNETWDAYVAAEVARAAVQPEQYDWSRPVEKRPKWCRPFRPGLDAGIDSKPRDRVSPYARMLQVNKRGRGNGPVQSNDRPGTGG